MRKIDGQALRLRRAGVVLGVLGAVAAAGTIAATQASGAASNSRIASAHEARATLSVTKQPFGDTVEPYTGQDTQVYQYTLTNANGMSVQILTYGGIIQAINVPALFGQPSDVVLGFPTLQDYVAQDSPPVTANGGPYFGEIIGRYANRIAKGTFTLNQPGVGPVTYTVPVNDGPNSLNGGLVGFGNHIWADQSVQGNGYVGVQLTLVSPNGDQAAAAGTPGCPNGCTGFPCEVKVVVTYTLNNLNQLSITYQTTDESSNLNTIVNLTNDTYFNLAGESAPAGSAYDQYVQINAKNYTPTDTTQIPLGTEEPVSGTPFDFGASHTIGSRIDDVSAPTNAPVGDNQLLISQGYDENWVLNPQTTSTTGPDGLNLAARAVALTSGRSMSVWTNQPGVQFSTANSLTGTLAGYSGDAYRQGAGYTLETQHFPNSPNQPSFPSTVLDAGQTSTTQTIFQFTG